MDVAREAFVRFVALAKWREIGALGRTGLDRAGACRAAARFPGRGAYEPLWVRRWEEHVLAFAEVEDSGALFGAVERAVAAAIEDEVAARRAAGDGPLDEDPEYRRFIESTLGRLAWAAGEGYEWTDAR
jgi:hypothetical protein